MNSPASQPVPVKTIGLAFIIFASALLMNLATAWGLLNSGPFLWAVAQPKSWQGGLEAMLLCIFVAAGFLANSRWALFLLVLVPTALFARRHAFDLALLIDVLYLEIMVALGFRIQRWFAPAAQPSSIGYLYAFTTGLVAWSLCAWSASAFSLGSIQQLRWLTLALALLAAIGPRGSPTLVQFLFQRMRASPASVRIWCAALAGWLLVLFARSKVAIGYDVQWYSLQPEHVLVPNHSIFEPLGLVSPVHYYPKLYEMWLLPLSSTGDSSVLSGMTILITVLFLFACRQLMRDINLDKSMQMPVLALIATLPAFANSAYEAKPDVIATFFILLAAMAAARFIRQPTLGAASWLATGAALACASKLTAVPYAGCLLLVAMFVGWRNRTRGDSEPGMPLQPGLVTALLTLPVVAFVIARTWLLAGMPTIGPDPLVELWELFGLTLRAPAGTLHWARPQDWMDVPQLLLDALFRPKQLPHIVISWTGNVWLWFVVISLSAALFIRSRSPPFALANRLPMIVLTLLFAILAIGIRYMERGGDGNYFLFGLIPAIILASASVSRQLTGSPMLMKSVLVCIPAFVLFQTGYAFISGAWAPGTRAMDANFSTPVKGMRASHARQADYYGLTGIANYLKGLPGDPRVVGLVEIPALFILPARYEDLAFVSYSRPEYLGSAATLLSFMHDQQICCIVLPMKNLDTPVDSNMFAASDAEGILRQIPAAKLLIDRGYFMVDASAASEADWRRAIELGQHARQAQAETPNPP